MIILITIQMTFIIICLSATVISIVKGWLLLAALTFLITMINIAALVFNLFRANRGSTTKEE
ncbi:MAG: hypothetical protein J5525_12370 [Lachnospiraceae bacterium]|nr:hypothetical protein [Lachnospiraceae bacterium]